MQIPDRSKSYKYFAGFRADGGQQGTCETDSKSVVNKFIKDAKANSSTKEIYLNGKLVYRR